MKTGSPAVLSLADGAIPLLGHSLALARDPLAFIASLTARGDIVVIRLGPKRVHFVADPGLVREVLVKSSTYDKGGPFWDNVKAIFGNDLSSVDHAAHRRLRRLIQPAFHTARLTTYADVMTHEAARTARSWQHGDTIEVLPRMMELAARVAVGAIFPQVAGEPRLDEIISCLQVVIDGLQKRIIDPLGLNKRWPGRANRTFVRSLARIRQICLEYIDAYRADPEAGRKDLLAHLLRGEGADRLSEADLVDQVFILLTAGIETTANVLAWSLHLLGGHPRIQHQIHAEVAGTLTAPACLADIPRLPLTARIITETLRLYPPGWLITRRTTGATVLGGIPLREGTVLAFSAYAQHRNPDLFAEPAAFDPDRWLPVRSRGLPRDSFIPFGAGSRKCIGDEFAMAEMTICLATLMRSWSLAPEHGSTAVQPRVMGTLSPGRLPMTVRTPDDAIHSA